MSDTNQGAPADGEEQVLSPLSQAALNYATNNGYPLFPCYWITDAGACSCGDTACTSPGKHPLTTNGFKNATTDRDQIEGWWATAPTANIGIRTGSVSGFDVVDVDTYKGGAEALDKLRNGHELPNTPISETGRGGLHILFQHHDGQKAHIGDGIDWKGDGGYIIAPPSRGALQPYRWQVSPDNVEPAPLPEWLCRKETTSTDSTNGSTPNWDLERSIVRRALTHVDPGSPRDDWLRIGMAVHHASAGSDDGRNLWHDWSAGELRDGVPPGNYSSRRDIENRWSSFSDDRESAVTVATLYAKAKENGFQYAPNLRFGSDAAKDDDAADDEMPELPTAGEFLQRTYPDPEFLIGPIQNQNIVLIHGPTGIGKTQLGAAIAKSLGKGESWLHWVVERACRLLFIDAELPPGVLQQRLHLHSVNTDNVRVLNAIELSGILGQGSHLNLADPHWQAVVWYYMTRYQSEVVLVDNVMSAVSVPGISMLSDEFWKPAYDLALKWRGAGLTSIWFDHSNSAGAIFGTKTKTWNADLVVKLSAPDDHDPEEGCRFVVDYEKHRGLHGKLVRGFTAWMDTPEPTLRDINPDTLWKMDWATDSRQEEVWALAASGLGVRKIATQTGVAKSTVSDWIRRGKRLEKC